MRFPEFTGEWERNTVSDLLEFFSTNSLSWEELDYQTNVIYNLHYGLIHLGLPTLVDIKNITLPSISDWHSLKNYEVCRNGDIAFADASEDTDEVAKAVEFTNIDDEKIVCGLHCIHGRDKTNKTSLGFKGYAFSSSAFHNQIRRLAQGSKVYSINRDNFSECSISIPSKAEQSKIATFLTLIDTRIATQNKIIDKFQSLIKGLYQNLFSEIEAEPLRLGDVCKVVKGQQINGDQMVEKGKYYVMNGGTKPSGYYFKPNVNGNTISISEGGSCGYVQFNIEPFWSGGHCYTIENISDFVNKMYLYHFLKANEKNLSKLGVGSGLPNIQKKDLENFMVLIPPVEMQLKISSVLSALERKMQCELSSTELFGRQKNYLLRRMFI